MNLLNNTLKFTTKNHITVNINHHNDNHNKPHLMIAISDNNININEQTLAQLFESFAQDNSNTTHHYGNNDLKLTINKELIKIMNDRIKMQNTLNQNTHFTFNIPLLAKQETPNELNRLLAEHTTLLTSLDNLNLNTINHLLEH